jgi:hypothetical protein
MTPDQAIAREAIKHTMSVYNTEGDRGRLDGLASAFFEDGVLETENETLHGRAAIAEGLGAGVTTRASEPGRDVGFVRHNLTTSRVEFRSDTEANSWTYFIVFTKFGPDHMGTYIDNFKKSDDRWLIAHRRVKLHWKNPESSWHDS